MLNDKIELTIGAKKGLEKIMQDNPDRKFRLFSSTDDDQEYMLMDLSNQKPIFHSGLEYYVSGEVGNLKAEVKYLECRYITLNENEQKVFKSIFNSWNNESKRPLGLTSSVMLHALKDDFNFLLIDNWTDVDSFMIWNNESDNKMNNLGYNGDAVPIIKTYQAD